MNGRACRLKRKNKKNKRKRTLSNTQKQTIPIVGKGESKGRKVSMTEDFLKEYTSNMEQWQHRHEVAYWKAKAEALTYENKVLHDIIYTMYTGKSMEAPSQPQPGTSCTKNQQVKKSSNKPTPPGEQMDLDDEPEDESDFVISEEFLSFLKESMQHKMEREKLKQENVPKVTKPAQSLSLNADRMNEMKLLYGKTSSLIAGLEAKVNLNYDSYKDKNKPILWPHFPLNPFV